MHLQSWKLVVSLRSSAILPLPPKGGEKEKENGEGASFVKKSKHSKQYIQYALDILKDSKLASFVVNMKRSAARPL